MISFLTSPLARWIGAAVIALVVLIGVYAKGRMDEHKVLVAYKAEVTALAKAQEDKVAAIEKRQVQITKKAEVQYAQSLASIRSAYAALRLRGTAGSGQVSTVPDPAKHPDAAAAYYVSVAPDLAERCAETTQQLTDLQDWVGDQQENAQ